MLEPLILAGDAVGAALVVWLTNWVGLILVPVVLPRRARSHPNLYDRLLAVGVQPDFERPKPARTSSLHVGVLCGLLGILIGLKLAQMFP